MACLGVGFFPGPFLFRSLSLFLVSSAWLFKLKWKKEAGRSWREHNPLIFGKYLLHASERGLYLFDQKGTLLWSFKKSLMNGVVASPDFIVGSDLSGYVYALFWDGEKIWEFKTGSVVYYTSLGDLNGDGSLDVVVGSTDSHIYALSGRDGRLLWKFKTGRDVVSSPALGDLDGDGYLDLAVASYDGYLYVFEATVKGGKVVWSNFHGDACGTGLYENAVSFTKFNLSGKAFTWYPHKGQKR